MQISPRLYPNAPSGWMPSSWAIDVLSIPKYTPAEEM